MARRQPSGVSELTKASNHRLEDARALLVAKRWQGAMYMAGYAVECLHKTKLMQRYRCRTLDQLDDVLRQKRRISDRWSMYSHELLTMMELLGCVERVQTDPRMWRTVNAINQWSPAWRYTENPHAKRIAADFIVGVERVLQWIQANTRGVRPS